MIYSMTGFAALERETVAGTLLLDLRADNHRYLEVHMRLDESLRSQEPALREAIAAKLGRGKVECRATLVARAEAAAGSEINAGVLDRLAQWSAAVQQRFPESRPLTVRMPAPVNCNRNAPPPKPAKGNEVTPPPPLLPVMVGDVTEP